MAASDDLLNQWKQEQEFTAAPPQGAAMGTSGSDALLNSWKKDLDSNITISIQNAAKGNPERAAEAQKIARALFVPTETVEKNWENLSAFAKTRQFQMQREAADDPVLAQMYANPDFAAIGFDDYPNISKAGQAVRNLGKQPERTLGGTGADILVTAGKGIIGTGEAAVGLADIVTKGWVGKQMEAYLGYDPKASKEFLETFYSDAQKYANQNVAEAKGIMPKLEAALSNPSVIATTIGESIPLMLGGGVIGRGLGALRGLAGNPITRSAIGEGVVSAGSIAEQTRQGDGIPNITIFGETAEPGRLTTEQALASVVGGAATSLIAQVGAKAAQRLGITDIDVLIAGGNTANPALNKSLGRQIIEGGIVEGFFQEMPQSAVEQLVSNYAQGRPVFEGMDDALVMGTLAGIAMGGAGPIVSYPANVRAQREAAYAAEEKARIMELYAGHAQASAVLKRDPDSFQNYIEQVSEDGSVQNVFIKASVLQQLGVAEELAAAIPAVAEQLRQAATPEQEIQISVADYATKIAPTEANAVLLDNIRIEGETMTRAEATAFIESESETLKTAYDQAQKTQVTYDEFKKSAKSVEADLLGQFNATGMFVPADSKVQAALYSRVFSMLALRMKQTPEQVYQKFKTTIAVEGQTQAGESFEQTVQALTATPEFQQWFGNSVLTTADGKPVPLYHGTVDEIEGFDLDSPNRKDTGWLGTGVYLTDSPDLGSAYADAKAKSMKPRGQRVMPLYASLQNPYMATMDDKQRLSGTGREGADQFTAELKAQGYDGVILDLGNGDREIVVFDPAKVKSIFNEGSWSPETNNILKQSATLRSGKETLKKYGLDPNGTYKTREIAAALEARQRDKWGAIAADDRSPEALTKIAKWMQTEVEFEMENPEKSGVGWYSEKFQRAVDIMGDVYPELKTDKSARDLMTALIAITSDGQKVVPNFAQAMDIYGNFRQGGATEGLFTTTRGHQRQASIDNNLQVLQRLYDQMGPVKLHEYLMQEKTISELKKIAKANGGEMKSDYQAHISMPMAAVEFGPKLGAFYANLMGAHGYLTMDRWWSRTFNRYRGTLLQAPTQQGLDRFKELLGNPEMSNDEAIAATVEYRNSYEAKNYKNGTEIEKAANTIYKAAFENLEDAPFNAKDRTFMLDAVNKAQQLLAKKGYNLSVADIQAILWYYEKRLYGDLGARQSADISYEDAARRVVASISGQSGGLALQDGQSQLSEDGGTAAGGVPVGEEIYQGSAQSQVLNQNDIFYSALQRAFENVKQGSMPADQWLKWLSSNQAKLGVKKEEIEATGLREYLELNGNDKLTKEQISGFLQNNGVQIQEVMKGGTPQIDFSEVEELPVPSPLQVVENDDDRLQQYKYAVKTVMDGRYIGYGNTEQDALSDAYSGYPEYWEDMNDVEAPKYAQWVLPGGENYKELLLTLPTNNAKIETEMSSINDRRIALRREYGDNMPADVAAEYSELSVKLMQLDAEKKKEFVSSHWDEANILAHIRFNERTDADGKRVLFIEELQSDWAQAGRKQGFFEPKDIIGYKFDEKSGEVVPAADGEAHLWGYRGFDKTFDSKQDAINWGKSKNIPDAPFVKDTKAWVGLSIKRMIRYAAENGFDKVAFVNGEQSADRYDLSKQLDKVLYSPYEDGTFEVSAVLPNGQEFTQVAGRKTLDEIEQTFGKEIAQKMANGEKTGEESGVNILSGEGLKVGGEGMIAFYDKIVPQVANDVLKKLGGGKVETVPFSFGDKPYAVTDIDGVTREFMRREEAEFFADENPGSTLNAPEQQLGFTITPAMRDSVMAGQALFQKSRGYIDPKNLIAILTPDADRSTPGHELAHAVVEIYTRIANTEGAPAEIISDLDQLLTFAGVQGGTQQERLANWSSMSLDQQRPFHEAIAYNWEIYLAEGKAPSVELQSVFDRLSQWIRDLYTVVRDHLNGIYKTEFGKDLPVMTEGVREVFDRMLASQEQIQQAETVRNMQVLFESKPEGMDDGQWAALQQMAAEARDASISKLTTDSVRQMRWLSNAKMRVIKQMQRENAALRAEMQQKVEAEIKASPVYKAISYIKDGVEVMADGTTREVAGTHKISIAGLEDLYMGEGDRYALLDWSQLPKNMYGTEGEHPDVLAERLGFQSGDQLVRTLISAPSLKEAVRVATDARMMEEYGEMNTQRDIDLAVERALHNEARARFVAAELRFVSRATAPARAMIQAAKRAAQNIIAGKLIKDLKPSEYGIAEARANKEAIAAQKKGDNAVVVSSMQTALLNNQLAGVAADTRSEIDKNLVYLRNVTSDRNRKRIGADAADQIDALLSRFDLSMAGSTLKTINEWMAKVTEAGMEPDIAPEMLNENFRKPFKMMTVREFNDLMDAVRQIEHVGRNEQMMLTAAQETAYKAARDEIVASIGVNARGRTADVRTAKTRLGKMAQGLHRFFAEHIKAATIARILDGGKEGPVWEYLIRPANAAADRETAMRAEATRDLTEILAPVLKSKLGGKGTLVPSIGRALNKEERIAIALNMGNEGNMQRLLSGENWTIEQVMPILESLTAAELMAVQKIWDYSETKHKPLIAEQWRRLYGKEPSWVEPRPMTVRTADGKTVELRGGYYPIVYDPRASQRAGELYDAEQARMEMQGFISATISTSFAKSRVAMVKDRPLLLSLAGVYNGVNDVIHALAWQEVIIDANKLLRSYSIDQAIRTTYGPDFKAQLKNWIKDVAVGERASQDGGTNAINFVRQSVSAAGLGFNIMSALQQVTGLSSSIVKLGPQYVGRGVYKTMAGPAAAIKMVNAKSSFMANRARTQFRELNELRNMVQGETSVARNIKVGAYLMMAQMQRMVDVPTWIGAYEKAIGQGNDEARAIALADQAVIDSQGGGMLKDLSKIERGGPWMKLFTVFYSYMNTQFNLLTAEAMTERSKAKLAAKTLMLTIVPVVLAYAIKHGLTPDDEDDWDWEKIAKELVTENIAYLMGMMVIVRELGSAAKIVVGSEGGNRGYGGPAGTRMISDLYSFATQASQGEFDDAFRKSAINLLGDFTGLPSAQINRTINGIDALIEGKTSNPGAVFTGYEKR